MELLRVLPVRCSRKWRLCSTVAAGHSFTSPSRSLPAAFSSSFGGLPEPFFGARESLRRAFLA